MLFGDLPEEGDKPLGEEILRATARIIGSNRQGPVGQRRGSVARASGLAAFVGGQRGWAG